MSNELPTLYQDVIHRSRYARWLDKEGRRENWDETVGRYMNYWMSDIENPMLDIKTFDEIEEAIVNLEVMPSMRALMTAGEALRRDNIAGYNCAFRAVDDQRAFDEILYVLMNGTGVGFSIENRHTSRLPCVSETFEETDTCVVFADSKRGWANGVREIISLLYQGSIPKWDVSRIRPAGRRLRVFGGRASGPDPLEDLIKFLIEVFGNARGRKLSSLECHDIVCKIAEIVVVGGVRRSALISLSDLNDDNTRSAKHGDWHVNNPQRALANNSACYVEKPSVSVFMKEWQALYESKSGERGIFSRAASINHLKTNVPRRDPDHDFGTNPCSEIILRSKQFCNLTEVVIRPNDTFEDLKRKVEQATILGTLQATQTNFKYIGKGWTTNTEEERLLGVSFTGIMDHTFMNGSIEEWEQLSPAMDGTTDYWTLPEALEELKEVAIETNKKWAKKLGIPESAAITCVKPSGTVSQLVDSASGIHTRHAPYYIRRIRSDVKDPLAMVMKESGIPYEIDSYSPTKSVEVFSFPMKAPDNAVYRTDRTAIEQLELWKTYAVHWCEHKPSVTISVKEEEWLVVQAWVYENFDLISGISFLPFSDHTYRQAPYEDVDEETYKEMLSKMPDDINWELLKKFEDDDNTIASQELACTGSSCEIVDLT